MFKFKFFALVLILLVSLTFAIGLIEPVKKELYGGETINLGKIGPGQTTSLKINPEVKEGGKFGEGGRYDTAIVSKLPEKWKAKDSKLYGNPLQVEITADEFAKEGIYYATITLIDEKYGDELNNITFGVRTEVTKDVLETEITPTDITVGPEQPARYTITITNKGSTADVFEISSTGIKRWEYKKPVYVAAKSSKTVYYEITDKEEENYKIAIRVTSKASKLISNEKNVTLRVKTDLTGDYKATNNGVLIFPFFENIIYSIAGLISNLF